VKINSAQSVFIIIGLFLATLSLGAGLTLVTESQDIRQMAAGGDAVVPPCSIALMPGDIVVSFSKNTSKFLSAKDVTRASVEATNISGGSIPAGTYKVFLESYDDHDGTVYTPGNIHYQIYEQWQAELTKTDGTVVAQSSPIEDVPDKKQTIKQQVNDALVVTQNVSKVIAKHPYYPADNPESVYPVCAIFRPNITISPTPTDTPPPNTTFETTVRVWEGNDCNLASSAPVPPEFSAVVQAVNHTDPAKASVVNHEVVIGSLKTTDTYLFSLYNLPPDWSSPACSVGPFSITSSSPNVLNFWVKKTPVLPWWRSQIGDIYGLVLKSMMPEPSNFLTSQLGGSDPGVVIWGDDYELNKGQLSVSTFNLAVLEKLALAENYLYFNQLTRGYPKTEILGQAKPASLPPLAQDRQAHMLKKNGDLNLTANWGSPSEKLVVLVSGNLKISTNQQVPTGSYLQFIVSGNIVIGPNVTSLHGIYSADGSIVIESSNQPFEAAGSVVSLGSGGIVSKRSLPSGDNATQASTIFTYRPDLVVNAPIEIRHKKSVWSEVPQ
jgi:hypothetical protein